MLMLQALQALRFLAFGPAADQMKKSFSFLAWDGFLGWLWGVLPLGLLFCFGQFLLWRFAGLLLRVDFLDFWRFVVYDDLWAFFFLGFCLYSSSYSLLTLTSPC